METEALAASRGFDGEHVPGVLGDDVGEVGDDEINLVLGVGVDASPANVRTYLIDTTVGGASGLYLHAPQAVVPAQDEVETFAVSANFWTLFCSWNERVAGKLAV